MGNEVSRQVQNLRDRKNRNGCNFPGYDYHVQDRKNWMSTLAPERLHVNQIVWPGTHNSATEYVGDPIITRPYGRCQRLSIYQQLVIGVRVLDIRVQKDRLVCHDILKGYNVDVVINDVKRFLSETHSEIIILEISTEYGQEDPSDFDRYLEAELGEFLIHQDDNVFNKTVAELLPKRIICIWKPRNSPEPRQGGPLWSSCYLKGDWTNTDLPETKFESNMQHLSNQPPVTSRIFFYKVENTVTAQATTVNFLFSTLWVEQLNVRIQPFARLFIKECISRGFGDRLQIFSSDFIEEDFVDACIGLTNARIEGQL
ncbi:hypothetical protein KY290_005491 [Solanum tuberosum]|uniref:Phosphatidylinositol-specific phospholipase C X domain-containing protein n=1 Tax=Solanum tuberosum TaxID=4113 RepID=A0ABQ7WED5_SOLTU|nr:hypothetical protein KY289_005880 [Solanum tuberosum]KAH0779064.1 hypothetical protein KY290_005491 [Solanum tuberosum]